MRLILFIILFSIVQIVSADDGYIYPFSVNENNGSISEFMFLQGDPDGKYSNLTEGINNISIGNYINNLSLFNTNLNGWTNISTPCGTSCLVRSGYNGTVGSSAGSLWARLNSTTNSDRIGIVNLSSPPIYWNNGTITSGFLNYSLYIRNIGTGSYVSYQILEVLPNGTLQQIKLKSNHTSNVGWTNISIPLNETNSDFYSDGNYKILFHTQEFTTNTGSSEINIDNINFTLKVKEKTTYNMNITFNIDNIPEYDEYILQTFYKKEISQDTYIMTIWNYTSKSWGNPKLLSNADWTWNNVTLSNHEINYGIVLTNFIDSNPQGTYRGNLSIDTQRIYYNSSPIDFGFVSKIYSGNNTVILKNNLNTKTIFTIQLIDFKEDLTKMEETFNITSYTNYSINRSIDLNYSFQKFYGMNNVRGVEWKILNSKYYSINITDYQDQIGNSSQLIPSGYHFKNYTIESWEDVPSKTKIDSGISKIFKLTYYKNAETGNISILTIPNFFSFNIPEFTWWNTSWQYAVHNSIPNGARPYQISLNLSNATGTNNATTIFCNGKCNVNFSDVRFTLDNTTSLPYWIENNTTGRVWVNVTTNGTVNMYYGNPSATSTSNITDTFLFGDVFDTNRWTTTGTQVSIANSSIEYTLFGSSNNFMNYPVNLGTNNFTLYFKYNQKSHSGNFGHGWFGLFNTTGNGNSAGQYGVMLSHHGYLSGEIYFGYDNNGVESWSGNSPLGSTEGKVYWITISRNLLNIQMKVYSDDYKTLVHTATHTLPSSYNLQYIQFTNINRATTVTGIIDDTYIIMTVPTEPQWITWSSQEQQSQPSVVSSESKVYRYVIWFE